MPAAPRHNDDADQVQLVNDRDAIERLQKRVAEAMERHGYAKAAVFAVRLASHEAISNAFHHGHKGLPPSTPALVKYSVTDQRVTISVRDQGPGFKPDAVPDPTLDENLEQTSGRGLMLMRAYMTEVEYHDDGRRLDMVLEKNAPRSK